jgi:hypothetical protein
MYNASASSEDKAIAIQAQGRGEEFESLTPQRKEIHVALLFKSDN